MSTLVAMRVLAACCILSAVLTFIIVPLAMHKTSCDDTIVPTNDLCENRVDLGVCNTGDIIYMNGTTCGATLNEEYTQCSGIYGDQMGVWYNVGVGDGVNKVRLNIYQSESDYNVILSPGIGCSPEICFSQFTSTNYILGGSGVRPLDMLVGGFNGETGNFKTSIECFGPTETSIDSSSDTGFVISRVL